jgi:nicotinamidase-related amidase
MGNSPADSADLHGNAPDHAGAVLLLVDVINDLDFPNNEYLVSRSMPLARRIRELGERCREAGIPVIYANDNRGKWRSDVQIVLTEAQRDGVPGHDFVRNLLPGPDDYVVLKPKHSVFLGTPLDLLLESIGAHTVILAGLTTNACVLVSAGELFVRGFRLFVPRDCVEALTPDVQEPALKLMEESYKAVTSESTTLDLARLLQAPDE